MENYLPFVLAPIILVAVAAWVVATVSYIRILRCPRQGSFFSLVMALGWFRMEKLEELLGPPGLQHLRRYYWAFGVFFLCIVLIIALAALAAPQLNAGIEPL